MLKSQQIGYQSIALVKLYNLLFEYIAIRRSVWLKNCAKCQVARVVAYLAPLLRRSGGRTLYFIGLTTIDFR